MVTSYKKKERKKTGTYNLKKEEETEGKKYELPPNKNNGQKYKENTLKEFGHSQKD